MNLLNKQKSAALATALMLVGANAAGESSIAGYPSRAANWVTTTTGQTWEGLFGSAHRTSRSHALTDVRHRRDQNVVAGSDVPALIQIMGEPMPHASVVDAVVRPRTPISRLFVKYITEPNVDVALTDAAMLVDELFQGDAAAKLLLTKSNGFKLADNYIYDVPMRARVAYLDTLIAKRIKNDHRAKLLAGDTIIMAVATGVALSSGLKYGPTQAAEHIRDFNWNGLVNDARAQAARGSHVVAEQADVLVNKANGLVSESAMVTRGLGTKVAGASTGLLAAAKSKFLPATHRMLVQQEVDALLSSIAARNPELVTEEVRSALRLKTFHLSRTEMTATQTARLEVKSELVNGETNVKRLVFSKTNVDGSKTKFFRSGTMDASVAERLETGFVQAEEPALNVFTTAGTVREPSGELEEGVEKFRDHKLHQAEIAADAKAPVVPSEPTVIDNAVETAENAVVATKDAVSDVAETVTESTEKAVDTVKDVAAKAADQVEETAKTVTAKAADATETAADKTAKAARKAADKGADAVEEGTAKTKAAAKDVESKAKPKTRARRSTADATRTAAVEGETPARAPRTRKPRAQTSDTGLGSDSVKSSVVDAAGEPTAAQKTGEAVETAGNTVADATQSSAEAVADTTEKTGAAIANGAAKVAGSLREFGKSANETISNAAGKAGASIKSNLHTAGERLETFGETTTAKASAVAASVRETTAKAGSKLDAGYTATRARLEREFSEFDRNAAYRDGTLVAAPGLTAWNLGMAQGFQDGVGYGDFGLEDQIPGDLLRPLPLEAAKQNGAK